MDSGRKENEGYALADNVFPRPLLCKRNKVVKKVLWSAGREEMRRMDDTGTDLLTDGNAATKI